ncbi:hypothetical protein H0K60_004470 [Salmonella enterica]|nr:hypothetical protein [Salmonella enterica]EFR2649714.1 hypothetical protein [Salmonella enterica]EFS1408063.1 hypothetical protein [Salmonella enterica]EHQ8162510.1 hypothetical protein [Salmonella enterica]EJZ9218163.1 hypothetical protein [Salmonella enterica]
MKKSPRQLAKEAQAAKGQALAQAIADTDYGTAAAESDPQVRRSISLAKSLDDELTRISRVNALTGNGPDNRSALAAEYIRRGIEADAAAQAKESK